jgi:hypothetical protein
MSLSGHGICNGRPSGDKMLESGYSVGLTRFLCTIVDTQFGEHLFPNAGGMSRFWEVWR